MAVDTDEQVAGLLKVLAEPLRWRIVELLGNEELCVCHLVDELGVAQPLVSHHLRVLREVGLVESEKWRYWTYYRLRADALSVLGERLTSVARESSGRGERRRPCC